jgi:hypothetical protein
MPFASSNTYVANDDLKVGPVKAFYQGDLVLGSNSFAAGWYAQGKLDLFEEIENPTDTVVTYFEGRIASITDGGITTYYTYDEENNIYSEVTDGITRLYEYDDGNLVRIGITP